MTQDVGNGSNQPPQRPMWQVQPGPVAGPFSPPPGEGQPGSRAEAQQPQHVAPAPHDGYQQAPLATCQQNAPQHVAPTSYAEPVPPAPPMTALDFLHQRHRTIDIGPATWGWRGWVRKLTFGLVKPKMGPAERDYREARATVQRSFSGPRTIMFANPKGGAAKTTSVLAAGYTFGTIRGGGVVAWDNNETRGTLGIRGERANHQNTTRELLDDLQRFQDVYESRIGDLGASARGIGRRWSGWSAACRGRSPPGSSRANLRFVWRSPA